LTFTFSCSSGGDSPEGNENPQVYNEDGTLYKGSGDIIISIDEGSSSGGSGPGSSNRPPFLIAGSVTNGIVKLELPSTISNDYLYDFTGFNIIIEQGSCTDYTENVKIFYAPFGLSNSNGHYTLRFQYDETRERNGVREGEAGGILYHYFSKAGKITCNTFDEENDNEIVNIDAKVGWNKIYVRATWTNGIRTQEWTTKNILTKKDVKWTISK
jgi:hypothetical protein